MSEGLNAVGLIKCVKEMLSQKICESRGVTNVFWPRECFFVDPSVSRKFLHEHEIASARII